MRTLNLLARTGLCALAVVSFAAEQTTARKETKASRNVWIRGRVLNDLNSQPLSRARVFLRSAGGETQSVAVEADEKGAFTIPNVVPGKYSLSAQRDGFINATVALSGTIRLPSIVHVEEGNDLRDVTFRLRPWSVAAGRVRFDDAEPAIGVLVQVYRDSWSRGRRSFTLVSFTRTNDRGEYRIAALPPGSYYIAASYDRPLSPEYQERDPVDENGKRIPQFRYSTTFYPNAQRLGEAEVIRLSSAQEIEGLDIFLQPVRTVSIRGSVLSGLTGQPIRSPNVTLRRLSADERSSINASISVIPRTSGFEIRGVAAGPYLLVADSTENGKRLFARVPLMVVDADIDDLQMMLEPEIAWRGSVNLDNAPNVAPGSLRLTLEPRSDLNPIVAADVRKDGSFVVNVVPDEVYDAYLSGASDEVYIQAIRTGNMEVGAGGIAGQAASSNAPLQIVLSSRDSVLAGAIWAANGAPASGCSITVVPQELKGRAHLVKTVFADLYGHFQVRGLAPGAYTAFAYYDEAPCEFYDAEAMTECRAQGTSVTVGETAQAVLSLRLGR